MSHREMAPPFAEVSKDSAQACLERVLRSREFARAARLRQLLEFLCRETLAEKGSELKETVVAVEVFGRDGSFDSQRDSVVRVAIRNLRARLERYYETEGLEDAVRIEIPLNSYAPAFRAGKPAAPKPAARARLWRAAAIAGVALAAALIAWAGIRVSRGPLRSVVVGRFTAQDGRTYLGEAFAEEVAAKLERIQGLRVARPSAARRLAKLEDASRFWGAEAAVEGQVYSDSARAGVQVRLVSVPSGRVLWTREFERPDRDLLRIRDEACSALAAELGYAPPRAAAAARETAHSAEVRDLYWEGRFRRSQRPDGLPNSVPFFERAVERDPAYAEAWAALAYAKAHMAFHRFGDPGRLARESLAAADRALELNRNAVEAHLARGLVEYSCLGRWKDAEVSLRLALLADPNHAKAHNIYAIALATRGRFDEALRMMDRAEALDPMAFIASNDRPLILYMAGRWDEAIERSRGALRANPSFYPARIIIGSARLAQGRVDEAVTELRAAYEASERDVSTAGRYGVALAAAGRQAEAGAILKQAEASMVGEPGCPIEVAALMTALRQPSRAMDCLEQAARVHLSDAQFIAAEPMLTPLAGEPRFQTLKRNLGL
jgi:adenylate cyclase